MCPLLKISTYLPAICVVVQLHHCSTVSLQCGVIFAISIHVPEHCSKKTQNTGTHQVIHSEEVVASLQRFTGSLTNLHMSLSNPEEARVAPLG